MGVAFFDLDNTLIGGDSDYLWGEYLADIGAVPAIAHREENQRFFEQYQAGTLDPVEFLSFQLRPLASNPLEKLLEWRADYVTRCIEPLLLPLAAELLDQHRREGRPLVIVTSTNSFITRPIADLLGVRHLLATDPEMRDGTYTGRAEGTPCFAEGKVVRVNAWLDATGHDLEESWFYSDSRTDLPLLRAVTHPVAVDPDEVLEGEARRRSWPVISLR